MKKLSCCNPSSVEGGGKRWRLEQQEITEPLEQQDLVDAAGGELESLVPFSHMI